MITKNLVLEALKTVMDPELHVDIVSLGLIYDVEIKKEEIKVRMTLTTPGCPLAPVIDKLVREAVAKMEGHNMEEVKVQLEWEPAWTKERMSEEAKLKLGIV